jgi:ribosome-associated heat shock protein Hsp15
MESVRVDQWLWGVRLFKTRSLATDACRGGHVRVNGSVAKAATPVRVGDRIEARVHGRDRILEVVRLIDKRAGAAVAATCMVDHSPPPPPPEERVMPLFSRERGAGRPTKRDRRSFDRFRRG